MVRITISSLTPSTVPTDGWFIRYRIKGSATAYTTVGPYTALPIIINTADPAGTLYEGFIKRDCGVLESTDFPFVTPCTCTALGYAPDAGNNVCQIHQTIAPTVTNPGYCLAPSTYFSYTQYGSRIYTSAFVNSDIHLPPGSVGGNIYGSMIAAGQWGNPATLSGVGPMNREGVWIDSDCDGTKDPLAAGVKTTLAYAYNNISGVPKTIYVGLGADNNFELLVNGVSIANSATVFDSNPFKIFHIFPIVVNPGVNFINAVATGDGTINDAMALTIYDNTPAEILAATSDVELNVLFLSSSLRGTTYDVSTCPATWSLDTSGGTGAYICRRTLTMGCNTAP